MSLVKYRPNRNLFFPKANPFFDDFFMKDWDKGNSFVSTQPKVNILDKPDQYEIHFAAPGLDKNDFNIKLDNETMTISYERKSEKKEGEKENEFTLMEFSYEKFERSFMLPDAVDRNKIKASYENGVLNVLVPKTEEAKVQPVKEIKVG